MVKLESPEEGSDEALLLGSNSSLSSLEQEQELGLVATVKRYPKGVFFMLGNEFCERFSFYGMRAVLTLYFVSMHNFKDSTAKVLYHLFVSICYMTPLLGSILADGWLGRFRVILYGSMIYCVGQLLLTLGAIPGIGMGFLDFVGLFVVALATGGIKPCVSAFAADQFTSDMLRERQSFFSFFYFAINCGALLSKIITPILRGRVSCLGQSSCFPLAFGVPAILMLVALILFVGGRRFYTVQSAKATPEDSKLFKLYHLVTHAICRRWRARAKNGYREHFLDYADDKFDQKSIDDVKRIVDILVIFVPVVVYGALFDQIGSTWVLQANNMNGNLGPITILPDQMSVLNPFFVMILIPLLSAVVYPFFYKYHFLDKPLKRMAAGGILAALAFFMAGTLQMYIDKSMIHFPERGHSRMFISNNLPCKLKTWVENDFGPISIAPSGKLKLDVKELPQFALEDCPNYDLTIHNSSISDPLTNPKQAYFVSAVPKKANEAVVVMQRFDYQKTKNGATKFIFVVGANFTDDERNTSVGLRQSGQVYTSVPLLSEATEATYQPSLFGSKVYDLFHNISDLYSTEIRTLVHEFDIGMGPVYGVSVMDSGAKVNVISLVDPNTVSLIWQIPQYIVITIGEIFLSVTGLEFSYSQAPDGMKSVVQAFWLLTVALGNFTAVVISGSDVFHQPHVEFYVYSLLMSFVMLVFVYFSRSYEYAQEYDQLVLKEK